MSPPWTNLASLAIGGPLYGLYLVLYLTSTSVLVHRSNASHTGPLYRSTVFISGLILFVAVTGNFCLVEARAFLGLIVFANGTEPATFYNDNGQITTTVQNIFAALAIITGDFIIIYRLWVVWSRNRFVIILPTLTLIGLVITLGITVQTTSKLNNIADDKGLTPGLVFTLVTNLYSTGFISWKIWMITRAASPVHGSSLRHFVAITVESAALYTAWAVFYIVTHQINADVQFLALGVLPVVAGISNALIQARIGMGKTVELRHTSAASSSGGRQLRLTTRLGESTSGVSRNDPMELKSVVRLGGDGMQSVSRTDGIELKSGTFAI
ncbi:hypothetical protein GGX14DRAFT_545318 [Mycena pura]|uniref:Uncharacterized protein n=1 Tax=Mycena pura TaxID=153505 RepID=A0AAD6Y9U2_9AGAR|nr:hypothetical protein GGX14DRAFT_545318 [Mycena pura]